MDSIWLAARWRLLLTYVCYERLFASSFDLDWLKQFLPHRFAGRLARTMSSLDALHNAKSRNDGFSKQMSTDHEKKVCGKAWVTEWVLWKSKCMLCTIWIEINVVLNGKARLIRIKKKIAEIREVDGCEIVFLWMCFIGWKIKKSYH